MTDRDRKPRPTPILDRVFPPHLCDDTWAARYYDTIDRRRGER